MRILIKAAAIVSALGIATLPVAAQAPELAMLSGLQKGGWTLALRGDGSERRICVRTGREFIQLRHDQAGCSRFIVEDGPSQVTVQYTCRGNGYGRTTIRQEGRGIVQISSQGIHGGSPFSIEGEARHRGPC